jgi:putative chitinase
MITIELLQKLCPQTYNRILTQYVQPLQDVCDRYHISDTKQRVACFIAQITHECGDFSILRENLNYSDTGLVTTFKKYFNSDTLAKKYAHQPEHIANLVYANRLGNGDESSGDGWKFRGRGAIQVTGKENYTKFAAAHNMSVDDAIIYLETPLGAIEGAGWFWNERNLNSYCDTHDFVGLTKRINGGTIGLEDRTKRYNAAYNLLNNL